GPGERVEDDTVRGRHEADEPAHERQRLDGRPSGAVRQLGPFGRRGFGLVAEDREEAGRAAAIPDAASIRPGAVVLVLAEGGIDADLAALDAAGRRSDTALPVEFGDRAV